jgi:hypothetical protein
MTIQLAVCPDGKARPHTLNGDTAIVEMRGNPIQGTVTEEDGVMKFRPLV